MARVKDILDDDEWKLKPLNIVLQLVGGILTVLIVYNALAKQPTGGHSLPAMANNGAVPGTNTVVLKYSPLIEAAQRTMTDLGVYKGPVDGVNGLKTQQAVQLYQQMNGMNANGEINEELVNQMKFARQVQDAAKFTGSTHEAAMPAAPKSPIMAATPPVPVKQVAVASPQQPGVKKVQIALAGLGYAISKLDGNVNEETRSAILKYEMDNGLDMNGSVDPALLKALKIQAD